MQEEILKLVKAAMSGNQEAQEQIELIMLVAQLPGADPKIVKVAQYIMQLLNPESARKGCKTKKKPLIPTKKCGSAIKEKSLVSVNKCGSKTKKKPLISKKKCGDKVKKGEFGFSSNRCKCILKRFGGTIIEVDSCTGLPYKKKGGILKGESGLEAWYNTQQKSGLDDSSNGAKHYYKDGNQWKVLTYGDNGWEDAVDLDPNTDLYDKGIYQFAFAKGYDPNTGFFGSKKDYDIAIANSKGIQPGNDKVVTKYGTTITFKPYKDPKDTTEGYILTNDNRKDLSGHYGTATEFKFNEEAAKNALWNLRNYYRSWLRNKEWRNQLFRNNFDDIQETLGIKNDKTYNFTDYQIKNYLKKYLGTGKSISSLYNQKHSKTMLGRMADGIAANKIFVDKQNETTVTSLPTNASSNTAGSSTSQTSNVNMPGIGFDLAF